jgi:hypothetical protein
LEELHNHGRGLNQRLLIKMSLAHQKDLLIKKTCFPERSLPFRKGTFCSARPAHRVDRAKYPPCIQSLVMLTQIGVKRLRPGLSQQRLEHHVCAATLRKMLAIGLSQRLDAGVAMLLVDAACRIAMSSVQALLGLPSHLIPPEMLN